MSCNGAVYQNTIRKGKCATFSLGGPSKERALAPGRDLGNPHQMPQHLNLTALLVDEYDTAIDFFVAKLGFELRDNIALTDEKRWVVVAPPGAAPTSPEIMLQGSDTRNPPKRGPVEEVSQPDEAVEKAAAVRRVLDRRCWRPVC